MAANSKEPTQWATVGKLVGALVTAGVLVAGILLPYIGGLGVLAGHEATQFQDTNCNLQESKPPLRTTFYASDGKTVIARIFDQDRVLVPLTSVPVYLRQALIATEDRRFYEHHGVDLRGLVRSAVSTSGGDTQGGSTLTMQYVKQERYFQARNNVAAQEAAISQNLARKMQDAKCALYIENTLHESKQEILDNYLNIAFFGENAYGIETAAETYFGKSVSKLSLGESALLVGLLRAPTSYDPFQHLAAAKERRNEVLQNLVSVGQLSQAAADREMATPIVLAGHGPPQVHEGCVGSSTTITNVAFFCQYAQDWLTSQGGLTADQIETGGYKVVTTLDAKLQNSMQAKLAAAIPARSPTTAIEPVVDPRTGDVLAMATSKSFGSRKGQTEQPVFTSYVAQGASTYKLFPLLEALGAGFPSTWELETHDPYTASNCLTPTNAKNGDANETYGLNSTLAQATATSNNTFFVGLADQGFKCQLSGMVTLAQSLGMKGLDQPTDPGNRHSASVAQDIVDYQGAQRFVLGSVATSPLELTGAYAAVANDGLFNAPAPILSITDSDGHAVPVKRTPAVQVVQPQVARQAIDILKGDTVGDGTSAGPFGQNWYPSNSSTIAGKTGTAQAYPNQALNGAVWFVGTTPDLTAATALVNIDRSSAASVLPGAGRGSAYGEYASRVWLRTLKPSLVGQHWTWPSPDSVAGDEVPPLDGLSLADARNTLQDANYKMALPGPASSTQCPSTVAFGNVAFFGPKIAKPGSTITVCPSSGQPQPVYVYVPPVTHHPTTGNGRSGNGGNSGSGNGNSGHGGSGNGNGNAGNGPIVHIPGH